MDDTTGKGTGEPGWTEQEKGTPHGDADPGEAGDAEPKGRPTSDREETEGNAAATGRQDTPGAPKP